MTWRILVFTILLLFAGKAYTQTALVTGKTVDDDGQPLPFASISLEGTDKSTISDSSGNFRLFVPGNVEITLKVSSVGMRDKKLSLTVQEGKMFEITIPMEADQQSMSEVVIKDKKGEDPGQRRDVSSIRLDPKLPKYLPSPFNDFNKILVTLPGVSSNNELSSQYTVRGGNFDENLVYVNDMEIYRPFLVRAGQQEGLSFVNPDMVSKVDFSSGGWQPRYGDKLSSVLAVKYKEPKKLQGSASLSLLTASFHIENGSRNGRISYVIGARKKSAQYLLRTLPVKGEYKPKFYDLQSFITIDLTNRRDSNDREKRTFLNILTSYARNRYNVIPSSRETTFGTLDEVMKLSVYYDGQEIMEYETYQAGVKLSHRFSKRVNTEYVLSGMKTTEREYSDVYGAYYLCELNNDPDSQDFNRCATVTGTGGLYDHRRNKLQASVFNFLHRGYFTVNAKNKFEWGLGQSYESINDLLKEYSFTDSSNYVNITNYINTSAALNSGRTQAYVQHTYEADSVHSFTAGVRVNYWSLNKQLLFSPRMQYAFQPKWKKDILFKAGAGVYQQPPFYRELRDRQGVVHKDVKAQTSYHFIAGMDYNFKGWGKRPFKFVTQAYYKALTNVIPYDMDNVRIRYFGSNNARAYATGMDFRISGEFIKGAESWFSLGLLSTKEDVEGDGRGYIRRPTDQRVTASIFFQDYFPNNPSIKMYLNLVYGSGLPFGPPNSVKYRSAFSGPDYKRVDIGFSKLITFIDREVSKKFSFESIWLSAEVLNLLGVSNTISYLWITDVSNNQYAIPNALSQRYVNLRVIAKF